MSQNINLFNPAFRKEERVVSLRALASALAVTFLTLVAIHTYLHERVHGLAEELSSGEALLKAERSYADRLKGESVTRKQDARLDAEIVRLELELKQARESMDALKGGVIGTQEGFAEYLRAFSRQSVNGLWLTGLTIGGAGDIEIRGRVLSPELVPTYIQRLNKEKVLAGRSFARLEMSQPKDETEKAGAQDQGKAQGKEQGRDATKAARGPRFLEFSLATAEATKAEKTR